MLSRESLGGFKAALSEALRTTDQHDEALRERFVEPTPGTIATLQTNVNQLLYGRRGVGKSTTLAVLQQDAENNGRRVIFVDVESHKGRAYPDVLIDLVLDVLDALRPGRSLKTKQRSKRKRVRQLEGVLSELRDAGPEVTSEAERSSESSRQREVSLSATARKQPEPQIPAHRQQDHLGREPGPGERRPTQIDRRARSSASHQPSSTQQCRSWAPLGRSVRRVDESRVDSVGEDGNASMTALTKVARRSRCRPDASSTPTWSSATVTAPGRHRRRRRSKNRAGGRLVRCR